VLLGAVCQDNFDKFKLDKGDYTKLKEFLNLNWDKMLDPSKFSIDEMWESLN